MCETVRFSGDFEYVFVEVYKLKEKIFQWKHKTIIPIKINTYFFYNTLDDQWEGELEVTYEREI